MKARPGIFDLVVGLVVAGLGLIEAVNSGRTSSAVVAVCAAVAGAALAWRRHPAGSAMVVLGAAGLGTVLTRADAIWPMIALIVAMFRAGRLVSAGRAVSLLVGGLALAAIVGIRQDEGSVGQSLTNFLFVAVLMVGGPWGFGLALRRREDTSVRLATEAANRERLRLARELHDVVGHSLGAIAVQAGAERATLPDNASPSTRETLVAIERTTHEAMAEMRRLVSVMRDVEAGERLAPQPVLADVGSVLQPAREAGWSVDLDVVGTPVALGRGLDLTAYRIVQEAVTNAVRHSGGSQLRITIRYLGAALELEVADDGASGGASIDSGFGLTGMRERASLYGGQVSARRCPSGGFVVTATLPLSEHGAAT